MACTLYSRRLRWFSFLILLWSAIHADGQLTIHLNSIPPQTPPDAAIFIAGNFNNWNPGNPSFELADQGNGTYEITITPNAGLLEFKFTRGSWETVEGNANGAFIPNRTYQYDGTSQTLNLTIAGWEDGSGGHTASENVQIMDEDFFMPQLNRTRRVWLYLPPDYESGTKRYPVIYMHDGQNLFDAYYSFAGEWKVDETLDSLFAEGDYGAIVVGIDNGGAERFNEYCPWINPQYGGGDGAAYVSFVVNTLKPYIDATYRTLPQPTYTAIAGSSMGGLISSYAIAEYPTTFSKAGVFSPAYWVADSALVHVASRTFSDPMRLYFVASQNESNQMIPDMIEMKDAFVQQGVPAAETNAVNHPDGAHSEWFWAREFPEVYTWLFEGLVVGEKKIDQKKTEIIPNPVVDCVYFRGEAVSTFEVFDYTGQNVYSGTADENKICLHNLPIGLYLIKWQQEDGSVGIQRIMKI